MYGCNIVISQMKIIIELKLLFKIHIVQLQCLSNCFLIVLSLQNEIKSFRYCVLVNIYEKIKLGHIKIAP